MRPPSRCPKEVIEYGRRTRGKPRRHGPDAPMKRAVFEARAEAWKRSAEAGIAAPRPAKDTQKRLHACLVPWEELNEISALEQRLTGRSVDYQQTDINNVLALPRLLAAEKDGGGR